MISVKECDIMSIYNEEGKVSNTQGTLYTSGASKVPYDPMRAYYESALAKLGSGTALPSAGNVQNYYGQAQSLLGGLDTSAFSQLKGSLDQQYNVAQQGLTAQYEALLKDLENQGTDVKQQFGAARGTIMEDSFDRNRDMYRALAARGLGSSGLAQLGAIQQRMETGRQVSGAAQQYYGAEEALAGARESGTQAYTQQQAQAQAGYQSNLASLAAQEIQYKNAYQQQLASMALQLQSQAQNQANAAYSAEQQRLASELGLMGQYAQYQTSMGGEAAKNEIFTSFSSTADRVAQWSTRFGVSPDQARKEVAAYEKQYTESGKQDFFNTVSTALPRVTTEADFNSVMETLRQANLSGKVDINELVDYVSQNLQYVNKSKLIGLAGNIGVSNAAMQYGDKVAAAYLLMRQGLMPQEDYVKYVGANAK